MFLIPFKFPHIDVYCVFTTRIGGVSPGCYLSLNLSFEVGDAKENVLKNREKICDKLKIKYLVDVKQVHGSNIVQVSEPLDKLEEADAMTTWLPEVGLLIKTADCQPILVAHKSGKYIGAFHVGWRANKEGYIKKWIDIFCKTYSVRPDELMAVRGPSLCPEHSEFVNYVNEWENKYKEFYNASTKTVDLWALTYYQFLVSGLLKENIFHIDLCTFCNSDMFFSYRREKICGRQGGIIWIKRKK